jgi:hypothetical protein
MARAARQRRACKEGVMGGRSWGGGAGEKELGRMETHCDPDHLDCPKRSEV